MARKTEHTNSQITTTLNKGIVALLDDLKRYAPININAALGAQIGLQLIQHLFGLSIEPKSQSCVFKSELGDSKAWHQGFRYLGLGQSTKQIFKASQDIPDCWDHGLWLLKIGENRFLGFNGNTLTAMSFVQWRQFIHNSFEYFLENNNHLKEVRFKSWHS